MRAALLSLAEWTIPGLLTGAATVLLFPLSPDVHAYIGRFAAAFMASWWIWAGITPVVRTMMRRAPLERPLTRPLAMHGLFALTAALLFAAWFTWMLWLSRPPTLPPEPYVAQLRRIIGGHMLVGVATRQSRWLSCKRGWDQHDVPHMERIRAHVGESVQRF